MSAGTLTDELVRFFKALGDATDRTIALGRVLPLENPETLEALGNSLDLSRERVRQREARIKRRVETGKAILSNTSLDEVSRFATAIGQGLPQNETLQLLPAPFSGVGSLRNPPTSLTLFLYVAGPYELWGDLLLQKRLRARIRSLCQQSWSVLRRKGVLTIDDADRLAAQHGVTSPDVVNEVLTHLQSEHSHVYSLPGGKYVLEPRAADRAVRALTEHGDPLALGQLARVCEVAPGTLLNAISNDSRIARLDRNTYGLKEWGHQEYDGIVGSIHKALELMDGIGPLEDVADWVTEHFDVSWNSVISYGHSHHDFVVSNGMLRLRNPSEEPALVDNRTLGEVGDCLVIGGYPTLRVMIDETMWRGSGRPVPRAWAREIGLRPGCRLMLGRGKGRINVSWVEKEPSLGSVRHLASENGWPQRGVAFLTLAEDDLRTSWKPFPPEPSTEPSTIVQAMGSLFALSVPLQEHPLDGGFWMHLGERLGLEHSYGVPGMVLARLSGRRERVVEPYVDALRQALLISEARGLVVQLDV